MHIMPLFPSYVKLLPSEVPDGIACLMVDIKWPLATTAGSRLRSRKSRIKYGSLILFFFFFQLIYKIAQLVDDLKARCDGLRFEKLFFFFSGNSRVGRRWFALVHLSFRCQKAITWPTSPSDFPSLAAMVRLSTSGAANLLRFASC